MRVVTWNVNSVRARLPRLLELLSTHEPDLVCLQELKCAEDAFPAEALADAGYSAPRLCGGRWAGVAVLARAGAEIADVRTGLPGEARPEEARWVEAVVDGWRVASVYVPNGREPSSPAFADKLVFLEAMLGRLTADDAPDLVAGDLNVARDDSDVWDPEAFVGATHVTAAERERLAALLEVGYLDAYRDLHPDEPQFSWWDYRAGAFPRNHGMRIDFHLLAERHGGRLTGCGIDRDFRKGPKPSDHAPLIADLDAG